MADQTLPFTLQASLPLGYGARIAIGKNRYVPPQKEGYFWITIFDRAKIEAGPVYNVIQQSSTEIPVGIEKYLNNKFLLCVVTQEMPLNSVPQGDFYKFLITQGAGKSLRTLEQLFIHVGSSEIQRAAYCLVTIPGVKGEGFEALQLLKMIYVDEVTREHGFVRDAAILTISLKASDVGGVTQWYPADIDE